MAEAADEGEGEGVGERLRAEFAGALDRSTVTGVVQAARRDLAGVPVGALPELIERLAREELRDRAEPRSPGTARNCGAPETAGSSETA